MRTASKLVSLAFLTSAALATTARAEETTPVAAATAAPAPARHRRIEVGAAFLPMSLGHFTSTLAGFTNTQDAKLSPGLSLSAGYEVFSGTWIAPWIVVGIAPQIVWDVKWKESPPDGAQIIKYREDDFMARVAIGWTFAETIRLYLEVLPGYSRLIAQDIDIENSTGFVIAGGAGVAMDLGDRMFVNFAGGYQKGYQKQPADLQSAPIRSTFVRAALGVGARF